MYVSVCVHVCPKVSKCLFVFASVHFILRQIFNNTFQLSNNDCCFILRLLQNLEKLIKHRFEFKETQVLWALCDAAVSSDLIF